MAAISALLGLAGCATTVVRHERVAATASTPGSLAVHPTFSTQGTARPTFTIRYFNDSPVAVELGPAQIRAFFRDAPVAIYSHAERLAELRSNAWPREVAHAILGTAAAVALLYGLWHGGHQAAIVSGHAGSAGRHGDFRWHSHAPLGGVLVGAAAVAAAGSLEPFAHDADSEALVADAILRPRRVAPGHTVIGQLVLKDCCDAPLRADDIVRIEVTVAGAAAAFTFVRRPSTSESPVPTLAP